MQRDAAATNAARNSTLRGSRAASLKELRRQPVPATLQSLSPAVFRALQVLRNHIERESGDCCQRVDLIQKQQMWKQPPAMNLQGVHARGRYSPATDNGTSRSTSTPLTNSSTRAAKLLSSACSRCKCARMSRVGKSRNPDVT